MPIMAVEYLLVAIIFTLQLAANIDATNNQGRLLTPQEGCGSQPQNKLFLMQYHKSWPWVGSLLFYSPDIEKFTSNCTATLITSRHSLTSADCASNNPAFIRLGETPKISNLLSEHEEDKWVVVDKAPKNELNIFTNYVVARWVIHPKAKATALKNNIGILFLANDVEFSDRIRPACLPPKATFNERVSEIYRLVRVNSFRPGQSADYNPKKYTQMDSLICALVYRVNVLDQTAFCAEGDDESGNEGDPFVVKIKGENGTSPIYQVGLDAIHVHAKHGIFLDLHPYVQWINDTISGRNID